MVHFIREWLGNRPDLNPLESLWDIIKRDLQGKDISYVTKTEVNISESWGNISSDALKNLALLLPRDLQGIKMKKGNPTNIDM